MGCIIVGIIKSFFGSGGGMVLTGIFLFGGMLLAQKFFEKVWAPSLFVQFAIRAVAALIAVNTLLGGMFGGPFSSGRSWPAAPSSTAAVSTQRVEPPVEELTNRNGDTILNGIRVNAVCENGNGRIYRVAYAPDWTVVSIIRTGGGHNQISLGEPGSTDAFFVEDMESGKKFPLRALRHFDDTNSGAGADLIFDAIETRRFNMIEGDLNGDYGWHFIDVDVPE
jgi:hypothetical protein